MSSGTKNSIGDFLRFIFSTLVDKDDPIFKALFANPEETGAIETIFNTLEATRNEWCNNSNVYNQTGEMLEKTLSYFSVLERLYEEGDNEFKGRNEILFYRNGDTLWGDKWDVLSIFKTYFGINQVYIVNDTNSNEENLFLDGDFETMTAWELINCEYSGDDVFSGKKSVLFNVAGAVCKQSIDIDPDSTYFVHFFLKGNIKVQILDNRGLYWNASIGEFGEWVSGAVSNSFSSEDWDAMRLFFLTDPASSNINISFISSDDNITYLDYTRFFKKGNWSSFTLIANFIGTTTKSTMGMAPGNGDDGSLNINYDVMSYIEQADIFGNDIVKQKNVYTELLNIVSAGGIIPYIDIVTKDI